MDGSMTRVSVSNGLRRKRMYIFAAHGQNRGERVKGSQSSGKQDLRYYYYYYFFFSFFSFRVGQKVVRQGEEKEKEKEKEEEGEGDGNNSHNNNIYGLRRMAFSTASGANCISCDTTSSLRCWASRI